MKKTIIALLTLACAASAAEELTLSDQETSFANSYDLSQDWTLVILTPLFNTADGTGMTLTTNIIECDSVSVNIFALESLNSLNINIPSVSLNTGGANILGPDDNFDGVDWSTTQVMPTKFTLTYDSVENSLAVKAVAMYGALESTAYVNQTITGIDIPSDTSLRSMTTGVAGTSVTFTGSVLASGEPSAQSIPEPTTATLSLLALAGLAARRRRK